MIITIEKEVFNKAVEEHITAMGIPLEGKELNIQYKAGRKVPSLTATVTLSVASNEVEEPSYEEQEANTSMSLEQEVIVDSPVEEEVTTQSLF